MSPNTATGFVRRGNTVTEVSLKFPLRARYVGGTLLEFMKSDEQYQAFEEIEVEANEEVVVSVSHPGYENPSSELASFVEAGYADESMVMPTLTPSGETSTLTLQTNPSETKRSATFYGRLQIVVKPTLSLKVTIRRKVA